MSDEELKDSLGNWNFENKGYHSFISLQREELYYRRTERQSRRTMHATWVIAVSTLINTIALIVQLST